ncbi:MAG: hypothetical protein IIZ63_12270 [Caulobacteraceae bacterium]|nr:hypothetical protein [Caulobacteraceae bacterium]
MRDRPRREPVSAVEIAFVTEKRRLRASWDACAAMLDRSVHDLRLACDPSYARLHPGSRPPTVVAEAVKEPPKPASRDIVGRRTIEARTLVSVAGGCRKPAQVALALGITSASATIALISLQKKELIDHDAAGWSATRSGHAQALRLGGNHG